MCRLFSFITYLVQKMDLMRLAILCFSMTLIKGKTNGSDNEVFAISGCNATLEWTLGLTYLTSYAYSINVLDTNGIEIAKMESMKCQHKMIDSFMYCEVRNISDKEWRLSVVLVNVTRASSGKYLGQISYGTKNETKTKELKIIDKPQIRESQTPILHKPFSTKCTVDGEFDDLIYHWKLNGTYFNSTKRINASSSLLTFERLTMTYKFSHFSCSVCSDIGCCIESAHYTPDQYYSSTYEFSPGGNRDLTTFASSPGDNRGHRVELLGLGLVLVAVLLVIIGCFVLVTVWRKQASTGLTFTGSRPLCQPDAGLNIPKSSREIIKKQDRPLPNPNIQENTRRNVERSNYPKVRRKSKSFNKLFDYTQKRWYPVRQSLSLQTLTTLSHTIGRRMKSEDSLSKMCRSEQNSLEYGWEGPADEMELEEMFTRIEKEKKLINEDRKNGAKLPSLNSFRHGSFDHESHNDLYSTIDQAALSINNYDGANGLQENLPKDRTKGETAKYEYDYTTLPAVIGGAENTRHLQASE